MLNFFKNKKAGYYVAAAAAVLSLIFIIIFYSTDLVASMPNSATAKAPETIGIFMIAALIAQIAFLAVPQFGFLEIVVLVLLGFSFYKELICCPQVLAAIVTGVAYEGGSLPIHLTYLILDVLIFLCVIVGGFMGYYKKDEEAAEDVKFTKAGKIAILPVAKAAAVVVVLVATVLASSLSAKKIEKGKVIADPTDTSSEVVEKVDPITDDIKAAAEAYEYTFDPSGVHFTKEDLCDGDGKFDFSSDAGISSLPTNGNRSDYNLVYKFEGSYAEGWQGDYSKTYAYLYLWEDGKFAGTSGSTQFRGYWYDNGGETLVMVTGNSSDGEIIAYQTSGFYSWIVDLNSSVNGGRRIKANGYLYYPEVALFIDCADTNLEAIESGKTLDVSGWTAQRVLKNLKYSSCYENNSQKVSWKCNGSNISNGEIKVNDPGTYEVTATWGSLSASITFEAK